jgi:hypothetical protein
MVEHAEGGMVQNADGFHGDWLPQKLPIPHLIPPGWEKSGQHQLGTRHCAIVSATVNGNLCKKKNGHFFGHFVFAKDGKFVY